MTARWKDILTPRDAHSHVRHRGIRHPLPLPAPAVLGPSPHPYSDVMYSPVLDLFVRLRKPLLNDDYAARRSICAFSAVEGVWAVRADRVVLRWLDECDSQRRLCDPTEPLLLRGGGVCRPPGRTSESWRSSNTAQTPTMLWRGHMLMILARLGRSESFWAVAKVRRSLPAHGPRNKIHHRLCIPHWQAALCIPYTTLLLAVSI